MFVAVNPAIKSMPYLFTTDWTAMPPAEIMAFCRATGEPSFRSAPERARVSLKSPG